MSAVAISPTARPKEESIKSAAQPIGDLCFIETQFPVSKMSKESYTERKANMGQTLTGLGKWWGRKPLVLCRATILGLLLPATDNPQKDREIFLRLMTMDDEGLLRRKSVNIAPTDLFNHLPPVDRIRYFDPGSTEAKAKLKRGLSDEEKAALQKRVFLSLSYDKRLRFCDRPEHVDGPSDESWQFINAHLSTTATSLPELVAELGKRRFGHIARVGDSFSGGGSIPFEAARIGCNAYASDLNPVAVMLTWASLNIVGGGEKVAEQVQKAQRKVYDAVDRKIAEWAIEHREPEPKTKRTWRADAYLYCIEVTCPECGWTVPLMPSRLIGIDSATVAELHADKEKKSFDIWIKSDVSASELSAAKVGTAKDSELFCPNPDCKARTPIKAIRGDGRGNFGDNKSQLRGWENSDIVPRKEDIFRERLYCIRWVDTWTEIGKDGELTTRSERHYLAPTVADSKREDRVLELLRERFVVWQKKGFIPNRKIEPGYNTAQPIRERGWSCWHHMFTPRQLLLLGLLAEAAFQADLSEAERVACFLGVFRCADNNSRLSPWSHHTGKELVDHVFSNQALNPVLNSGTRAFTALDTCWFLRLKPSRISGHGSVETCDARTVQTHCDLWITDPPYADAINYHEISEFFLTWGTSLITAHFPAWSTDTRRALAVKGDGDDFRTTMVDCYRALAKQMPPNGFQVVMFTHQDASVWADLSLILWAAGLRVTAAWCVGTETDAAYKEGNYVQGTVLLVLRKQTSEDTAFLDEVYQDVEAEIRRQLDTMHDLDDVNDPNFTDTDYQLAAYAAALRVLTAKKIQEIDVAYELTRTRKKGEKSPVEELIERAVTIACDHLVPKGVDPHLWKSLTAMERLYLKGLELESHGEHRTGVYQELARGFGVDEYTPLLANTKANETRLKNATEFGRKDMGGDAFGASLVRHALFAACKTAETESPRDGITWLKTEVKDYASKRQSVIEILEFLATRRQNASLTHWHKDAEAANLLAGALRNRQDNV